MWTSVLNLSSTRKGFRLEPNPRLTSRWSGRADEMLREAFLPDYGLATSSLALAVGVSRETINDLLRQRRAISPIMALKLARLFGNSPEFWIGAQRARDLWDT